MQKHLTEKPAQTAEPGPPEPTDTLTEAETAALARIERISLNARSAWFGLLALLGFVGVTLLGHRDADFFLSQKNTDLPLLNVSVPVEAFFYTAPILVAAVYAYLHLSLLALWDALADAPPTAGGRPLGDRAFPWLLNAWALGIRRNARWHEDEATRAKLKHPDRAPCIAPRPLTGVSATVTLFLAWGFGPTVLAYGWWRSMPAHDFWLTMTSGAALAVAVVTGVIGYKSAQDRLAGHPAKTVARRPWALPLTTLLAALALTTLLRTGDDPTGRLPEAAQQLITEGVVVAYRWDVGLTLEKLQSFDVFMTTRRHRRESLLAVADLAEVVFADRPDDWRPFELWLEDHRKPNGVEAETEGPLIPDTREMERYHLWLDRLPAAPLQGRDLRRADLPGASLPNVDLRDAQLQGANLSSAEMQGADLSGAEMQGASLFGAEMQGADLSRAEMRGTDLSGAEMQGADLSRAEMQGANFRRAEMQGADLSGAEMQGANFRRAEMQGADLSGAEMQNASCSAATLRGAALQDAIVLCRTIERMTLAEAVGTRETRLPIGLAIPSCLQGPESALSDELGAALDQRSAEAERPGFGTFIVRYSRETYLDMLLCDEGEVPVVFEGVWEAMGDGRWQNYVDGVIHAEGVGEDGEWGDIPAHWVTLPGAPPPEGRPLE